MKVKFYLSKWYYWLSLILLQLRTNANNYREYYRDVTQMKISRLQ